MLHEIVSEEELPDLPMLKIRQELRYYQTMVRVDVRALKAGMAKCKEIGKKMRGVQKGSFPV